MEGRARAAKNRLQEATYQAWHTAVFALNGYGGKLKPLAKYLEPMHPRRPQTPNEMLEILRSFNDRGAGMKITHKPN